MSRLRNKRIILYHMIEGELATYLFGKQLGTSVSGMLRFKNSWQEGMSTPHFKCCIALYFRMLRLTYQCV